MAVKTQFSDEEFREILLTYELGEYVYAEPIGNGTVQTNYFVHTSQGKYIFRYYENRVEGSVLFECSLLDYLKGKHYPCPAPYKNKQGKFSGLAQRKPYALFEFMQGEHLENPSQAQKRQLIQRVAELQNVTAGYQAVYKEYRWNYGSELCRKLAQEAAGRIATDNANAKLAWYEQELDSLSLPDSLPKGICHCDFHFSNVLYKDGEFVALIDFDDANYTYLTYDLITLFDPFIAGFRWDTWFQFEKEANIFDFGESRGVVAEYMKHRPLAEIEKRHLFDVYKLSVLVDCLWRFDRGQAADFYERRKIEALNGLGREGFIKSLGFKVESLMFNEGGN